MGWLQEPNFSMRKVADLLSGVQLLRSAKVFHQILPFMRQHIHLRDLDPFAKIMVLFQLLSLKFFKMVIIQLRSVLKYQNVCFLL
jgi:hypothetical protein